MATAKDIRRRIRTVKNIEKITSAMKMVAAGSSEEGPGRAEAARPYAVKMREIMNNLPEAPERSSIRCWSPGPRSTPRS